MTKTQRERLAHIRAESFKWVALKPEAEQWDNTFLLRLIDAQADQIRQLNTKPRRKHKWKR